MFEKIRNLKNKKGFTLVELIVVLVILAILAALLVPALTGYIDKARKQSIVAETRQCVMAAQTIASEKYGTTTTTTGITDADIDKAAVKKLAEVPGEVTAIKVKQADGSEGVGKIDELTYTHTVSGVTYTCTYSSSTNTYSVS